MLDSKPVPACLSRYVLLAGQSVEGKGYQHLLTLNTQVGSALQPEHDKSLSLQNVGGSENADAVVNEGRSPSPERMCVLRREYAEIDLKISSGTKSRGSVLLLLDFGSTPWGA